MALSARLQAVLDALPLEPGMRVLEVGAGPGELACEIAARVGDAGVVVACDRSATAVRQMREGCAEAIASGRMRVVRAAIEDLELDETFDLVVACRVGALDGRHPEAGARARWAAARRRRRSAARGAAAVSAARVSGRRAARAGRSSPSRGCGRARRAGAPRSR